MQKRSNISCMRQHQLMWALHECLAKILQILEVTLTNLILRMDAVANERIDEKFREMQNQTNNNTIHINGSCKKMKMDVNSDRNEMESQDIVRDRLVLAHATIDLLNTIDAGSKSTVMRTTEVTFLDFLVYKNL